MIKKFIKITGYFAGAIMIYYCCFNIGTKNVFAYDSQCQNFKVDDEILVKYKNENDPVVIKLKSLDQYDKVLEKFKNDKQVEYAEPNFLYQAALVKYDPFFKNQWYLQKVKAPEAWDKISESPSVIIAIIDSGVDIEHPDLKENIWSNQKEIPGNKKDDDNNGYADDINGWDFVDNTSNPSPKFSDDFTEDGVMHGTIIAGIAAAKGGNGEGIYGTTWKAQIMALRVLDDRGEGNTGNVIKAVDYAIANGANIINFSFVGPGYSQGLNDAIKRAHAAGIVIVAAAGNEQDNGEGYSLDSTPMYPVCHDGPSGQNWVIGVAATDAIDQKTPFSSYGFKCVDITAPGVSIYSTAAYFPDQSIDNHFFNNYYDGYWSGTSVASPIVAGTLSLILEANPSLTTKQSIENLLNGADNIYRVNPDYLGQLGKGRLNMLNSIELAKSPLNNFSFNILAAPYSKGSSTVSIFNVQGSVKASTSIAVYGEGFAGGINIATGDIDGDKQDEIITAPVQSGGPHILIFEPSGKLVRQFFAYQKNFNGGVSVATGDINGDGVAEIITGAGPGGGPHVRIFSATGKVMGQFFAYQKNFKGGISLAAGDINQDGIAEIITGAGPGGGPHVRIFTANGKVIGQFFAFNQRFTGGVKVASGNVQPVSYGLRDEIIVAPWSQGSSQIRVFNFRFEPVNQWLVFQAKYRGGMNLSVADLNNDGTDEIIVGAGIGGGPHIKAFMRDGSLISSFYAYNDSFNGGVSVGALKYNQEANPFQ